MNERIFDLARRSGATGVRGGRAEGVFCFTKQELNDFAERLVKECIATVESVSPGYHDYRDQIEIAMRDDCVQKLKNHFEVK